MARVPRYGARAPTRDEGIILAAFAVTLTLSRRASAVSEGPPYRPAPAVPVAVSTSSSCTSERRYFAAK